MLLFCYKIGMAYEFVWHGTHHKHTIEITLVVGCKDERSVCRNILATEHLEIEIVLECPAAELCYEHSEI